MRFLIYIDNAFSVFYLQSDSFSELLRRASLPTPVVTRTYLPV